MKTPSKKSIKKEPKKVPTKLTDYVSWFEIPALNFERAANFYNEIYDIKMEIAETSGHTMAFFPANKGIGGAIVTGEGSIPSDRGTLVYLNAGKDLNAILSKIEPAGGRIILPKTLINKSSGYFALFLDTEGNKIALHSKQ